MVMLTKTVSARKGFTLVELLITVSVIAILAAIGYVAYMGIQDRAREAVVRSDLTAAADVLHVDKIRGGGFAYPLDMSDADNGAGLPASEGTTYQYSANNDTEPTFCLTATNKTTVMHITQDSTPQEGACSQHGGA